MESILTDAQGDKLSQEKLKVIEEILRRNEPVDIEVQPDGSIRAVDFGTKKEHMRCVRIPIEQLIEEGWSY